jgi:hypothetical protein
VSTGRPFAVLLGTLLGIVGSAAAQDPMVPDSANQEIQRTLRAFYFNLARGDWEAMTAYILAAKVVAHRPPPDPWVTTAHAGGSLTSPVDAGRCAVEANTAVEHAIIRLDRDWAEVRVPGCAAGSSGADEFRLIRFEGRWRFVRIALLERPFKPSTQP